MVRSAVFSGRTEIVTPRLASQACEYRTKTSEIRTESRGLPARVLTTQIQHKSPEFEVFSAPRMAGTSISQEQAHRDEPHHPGHHRL